jgi:protein-tyrosine phosphatase
MLIDFHAHILPGADHGSDSLETSLHQLNKARAAGIGTIVATPHFYLQQNNVEAFLTRREISYKKLLPAAGDSIHIVKAAEVALSYDLASTKDLEKLCIDGTNYILIEMPGHNWTYWVQDSIYKITSQRGLRPIIAHIDRYDPRLIRDLADLDVLFQVNASALVAPFIRFRYMRLIREGLIHVIGSDAHGSADEFREYKRAVRLLKGDIRILTENAEAVLRGENIR